MKPLTIGRWQIRRIKAGRGTMVFDGQRLAVSNVAVLHRPGWAARTGVLLWRFSERRLRYYYPPCN